MEMFNKSRAQEAKMNLDRLRSDLRVIADKIEVAVAELKARCPHPDEYQAHLDSFYAKKAGLPRITLYHCKLCGQTKSKKGI